MFACIFLLSESIKYPGIRSLLGRKEMTRLKQTTLITLFSKVHPLFGITRNDFVYQDQKGLITYANGSVIQLADLARQPSDPDFDTFGSLELTHAVIEEGGEIVKKAKDIIGSRVNRYLNDQYGIVGKLLITGNPSQNFTRTEYYDPYKNLGAGDMQRWEFGNVIIDGEKKPAYKVFIKSLVTDNPKADPNYIERLNSLPEQEKKRLRDGNWDYMDTDSMLFTSLLIDRAIISEKTSGQKFIGVDVADKGKDKTVVTFMEDGIIQEQQQLVVDTSGEKAISELTSLKLIEFAQRHGLDSSSADHIAVEGNGVGVGVRDFMRAKGWYIIEYTATSKSRSRGFYEFKNHLDEGKTKIYAQMESLGELRKQLTAMTHEFDENLEPVVIKKKLLKEILGYSPDEADSAMICDWVAHGSNNERYNTNRIGF